MLYNVARVKEFILCFRTLPTNIEVTKLKLTDGEHVSKHWGYNFPGTVEEDKYLIDTYPSVGIRQKDDGSLIGWALTHYYWATAKAYVQPDFRNMGLFQIMIRELDSIKLQEGHVSFGFGFSRVKNLASKGTFISAGYTEVLENPFLWLTSDPEET